jgi:Na+-translocating ferredoxin:NAD+ oxidoreductase RnfA subunit
MNIQENIKETTTLANDYVIQEFELAKLKTAYQITSMTTSVAKKTIMGLALTLAILFLSISCAFWLGSILDNTALGFLLTGSFYLVILCILYFLRKQIEKYVVKKITRKYF